MNDNELIYRRVFCAPRELMWRCLTEPAELAQFWGPSGTISSGYGEPGWGAYLTDRLAGWRTGRRRD